MGEYTSSGEVVDRRLAEINTSMMIGFVSVTACVTIATTVFIFSKRTAVERPIFVSLQLVFLYGYWGFILAYFTLIFRKLEEAVPTEIHNRRGDILVTLGDLCYLLNDWIFTEQYLAACLMTPVAMRFFKDGTDA